MVTLCGGHSITHASGGLLTERLWTPAATSRCTGAACLQPPLFMLPDSSQHSEAPSVLLSAFCLQLLADVYIFTDHMTGAASGASPGYGITLVAETTSGRLLAAEAAAALDRGGAAGAAGAAAADVEDVVPEDIGQRAAHLLLEEIQRGGVVDSSHQVRCAGSYGLLPCLAAVGCRAAAGWHQFNSSSGSPAAT